MLDRQTDTGKAGRHNGKKAGRPTDALRSGYRLTNAIKRLQGVSCCQQNWCCLVFQSRPLPQETHTLAPEP
jgi:hypothetical protein